MVQLHFFRFYIVYNSFWFDYTWFYRLISSNNIARQQQLAIYYPDTFILLNGYLRNSFTHNTHTHTQTYIYNIYVREKPEMLLSFHHFFKCSQSTSKRELDHIISLPELVAHEHGENKENSGHLENTKNSREFWSFCLSITLNT